MVPGRPSPGKHPGVYRRRVVWSRETTTSNVIQTNLIQKYRGSIGLKRTACLHDTRVPSLPWPPRESDRIPCDAGAQRPRHRGLNSWASNGVTGHRLVSAGGEGADGHDERRGRSKSSCRNEPARMCAELLAARVVSRDRKLCRLGRVMNCANSVLQIRGGRRNNIEQMWGYPPLVLLNVRNPVIALAQRRARSCTGGCRYSRILCPRAHRVLWLGFGIRKCHAQTHIRNSGQVLTTKMYLTSPNSHMYRNVLTLSAVLACCVGNDLLNGGIPFLCLSSAVGSIV